MKLADMRDLKSLGPKTLWVRVPSGALIIKVNKLAIVYVTSLNQFVGSDAISDP